MHQESTYFKLLSVLLQYPGEDFIRTLPELRAEVARLAPGDRRTGIETFLSEIEATGSLLRLERYTAAFDLNPSTTLNMTYHIWRDGEKRAGVLAYLQHLYDAAGYENVTGELPDYLPLMLEFLSIFPAAEAIEPIRRCLGAITILADRLHSVAPPYAALLRPFADRFRDSASVHNVPHPRTGPEKKHHTALHRCRAQRRPPWI